MFSTVKRILQKPKKILLVRRSKLCSRYNNNHNSNYNDNKDNNDNNNKTLIRRRVPLLLKALYNKG